MACDVKQFAIAHASKKQTKKKLWHTWHCDFSTTADLAAGLSRKASNNFIDSDQTGESQQPPKDRVQISRQAGAHATDTGFLPLYPAIAPEMGTIQLLSTWRGSSDGVHRC